MKFETKPVHCDGEPYRPVEVKDGKTALNAVLSIVLCHTSDVFHGVVDAISDHYEISKEEMMEVICSHPSFTSITRHPILNDLSYLGAGSPMDELSESVSSMTIAEPSPQPQPQPQPQPPQKKKVVFRKKVAVSNGIQSNSS